MLFHKHCKHKKMRVHSFSEYFITFLEHPGYFLILFKTFHHVFI